MNINELHSFRLADAVKFHDRLNPALFDDEHLDPQVRQQLLVIATDFMEFLGITDLQVQDITLSGSNAAYSYTPHSDLDLHLIVDQGALGNDEIYQELFNSKKTLYNDRHNIRVRGYDVELYVQDSAQKHVSLGEYSILHDRWIKLPTRRRANLDERASRLKFEKFVQAAELAMNSDNIELVGKLLKIIKKYRQAGLDLHGEFGPENLAYKALKHAGYVDRLYQHKDRLHALELSLDEDQHPNDPPPGPEFRPTMPAGTVRVDVSDVYDWYKLGQHISNLDGLGRHDFGRGPPSTVMAFGDEDLEHKYIDALKQTGLTTTDIDPVDPRQPKNMPRQKTDPTYNVDEGSKLGLRYDPTRRPGPLPDEKPAAQPRRKDPLLPRLRGSYTPAQLRALGCWQDEQGRWHAPVHVRDKLHEASGYIPSEAERNDPRFKTALTVDVKPDSIKQNAKKLGWRIARDGRPPLLRK